MLCHLARVIHIIISSFMSYAFIYLFYFLEVFFTPLWHVSVFVFVFLFYFMCAVYIYYLSALLFIIYIYLIYTVSCMYNEVEWRFFMRFTRMHEYGCVWDDFSTHGLALSMKLLCLFPACCAAITELVLDDTTAHNVVQVLPSLGHMLLLNQCQSHVYIVYMLWFCFRRMVCT